MAINFPDSPSLNDLHLEGGRRWKWNGTVWERIPAPGAQGVQGAQGAVGAQGSQGHQGLPAGGYSNKNLIVPDAYAVVGTASSGTGLGMNWGAYNSSNGRVEFTFHYAQANANYYVHTNREHYATHNIEVTNKTTTGFRTKWSNSDGSNLSPATFAGVLIVYASDPIEMVGIGSTGNVGAQGHQGRQGALGAQGAQGHQGVQGAAGAQGAQGHQGRQGAQGVQGAAGAQGAQGHQGHQGVQGATGAQGHQGRQGAAGAQGAQGHQGHQGVQGAQGHQGVQGADGNFGGATFDYTFNTSTSDADPGAGKLAFNNGTLSSATVLYIDDEDGGGTDVQAFLRTIDDSTSTIKGHVRVSNRLNADDFAIFTISGTNTEATGYHKVTVAYVSGATSFSNNEDIIVTFARTGTKGDTGATGAQGHQGVQGAQGHQGVQGAAGAQGAQGRQGAVGAQGAQGHQGHQGVQGAQGRQGATGNTGAQGHQGVQGATGTMNINNNAANRIITGSGSANTLNGNTYATWNGNNFALRGGEGQNCTVELASDEGDDNADFWRMMAQASDNALAIDNYATGSWVEQLRIDSGGRVLLGQTSSYDTYGTSKLQVSATDGTAALSVTRWSANGSSPYINLGKSRGGIGNFTVVQDGDRLGQINFCGADGTDLATTGAGIAAYVDGTPGGNDMPGSLRFYTTPDGSNVETERLRIDRDGKINQGPASTNFTTANKPSIMLHGPEGGGGNLSDAGKWSHGALGLSNSTYVANGGSKSQIVFGYAPRSGYDYTWGSAYIGAVSVSQSGIGKYDLIFGTRDSNNDSQPSERMRITKEGSVGIGITNPYAYDGWAKNLVVGSTSGGAGITIRTGSSNSGHLLFADGLGGAPDQMGGLGYYHNDNNLYFRVNNFEGMRLDSSGRLLVGHTASDDRDGYNSALQVSGTGGDDSSITIGRWSGDTSAPGLVLSKSRNGTLGSHTVVQSGDYLGIMQFQGDDGSNYHVGAQIEAQVQAGVGNDDMPTDLIFKTNEGGTGASEHFRITDRGGHKITCNETYFAANLAECASDKVALNIDQIRAGTDLSIGIGAIHSTSSHPGLQAHNHSTNAASQFGINPFGGTVVIGGSDATTHSNSDQLVIGSTSGTNGITIKSGTGSYGCLYFHDANDTNAPKGQIEYNHNGDYFSWYTGGTHRWTLKSDGRAIFGGMSNAGTNSPSVANANSEGFDFWPSSNHNSSTYNTKHLIKMEQYSGNWEQGAGSSNYHTSWGLGWFYCGSGPSSSGQRRAGIAYDHKGSEEFKIWSSYGKITFYVDSATSGDETAETCNTKAMYIGKDGHVYPGANNARDLGGSSLRWRNIYTMDLQLSNEGGTPNVVDNTTGDWTLQEGENDIYMINNKTGKKYAMMLREVS